MEMDIDASTASESEEVVSSNLDNYILAGIIKNGIMSQEDVVKLIGRTCSYFKFPRESDYGTSAGVLAIVERINRDVQKYGLCIKHVRCELSGKDYFFVRPEDGNSALRFQTAFKKQEIAGIEAIFNAILKSDSFMIPLSECVTLMKKGQQKMSYSDARDAVYRFIKGSYLLINTADDTGTSRSSDDQTDVTVGCRGIEELTTTIQEKHPTVLATCKLCYKTLLHGYQCPKCLTSVHRHCCEGYIRMSKTCPGNQCNAPWQNVQNLIPRRRHVSNQSSGSDHADNFSQSQDSSSESE